TQTPTPVIKTYVASLDAKQDLPGKNTHIQLTSGDRLTLKASGSAHHAGTACDDAPTNPDGVSIVNGIPCQAVVQDIYSPAPMGTLLGNIVPAGTTPPTTWFVMGSNYSVTVWASGELYLIYNDIPGAYNDNNGSYQINITVVSG